MRIVSRIRTPTGRPRGPIATTVSAPFVQTTATYTDAGTSILVLPLNLSSSIAVYVTCLGAGDYSNILTNHVQDGGGGGAWADKKSTLDPGEVLTITVAGNHTGVASEVKKGAVIKATLCKADSASGKFGGSAGLSVGDTIHRGGDGGTAGTEGGGGGGGGASNFQDGVNGGMGLPITSGQGGRSGGTQGGGAGQLSTTAAVNSGGGCGGHGFDAGDPAQSVFGSDGKVTVAYSSIGAPHS